VTLNSSCATVKCDHEGRTFRACESGTARYAEIPQNCLEFFVFPIATSAHESCVTSRIGARVLRLLSAFAYYGKGLHGLSKLYFHIGKFRELPLRIEP